LFVPLHDLNPGFSNHVFSLGDCLGPICTTESPFWKRLLLNYSAGKNPPQGYTARAESDAEGSSTGRGRLALPHVRSPAAGCPAQASRCHLASSAALCGRHGPRVCCEDGASPKLGFLRPLFRDAAREQSGGSFLVT